MKKIFLPLLATAACLLLNITGIRAQSGLAVNTTGASANASAIFDASSTTQGMLIPRMTTAQRTAISSPATGLLVYQTDGTAGFYFYNGSAWVSLSSGASGTAGGDLTGSYPNPTIAATSGAGADAVSAINASSSVVNAANLGTGSSITSKFLRGDNTWQPTGSGTVTNVSSNVLTSGTTAFTDTIFHTTVISATTTPSIFYTFNNAAAYSVLTNSTNFASIPVYGKVMPQALWAGLGGTPSSSTYYRGDGSWQTPSSSNSYAWFSTPSPGSNATVYSAFGTNAVSTVIGRGTIVMPVACTIIKFYVYMTVTAVPVSGTNTVTLTLYKNGSATSVTCSNTLSASEVVGNTYQINDLVHTASFSVGDLVTVQITQSNTSGALAQDNISVEAQ